MRPPVVQGADGVSIDLLERTDDPVVEAGASLLRIWGVDTAPDEGAPLPADAALATRAST